MAEETKPDKNKKETTKPEKKDTAPDKPVKAEKVDKKEKIKLTERIKKFLKDYRSELKKIVWSTREQVIQNTGVVLVSIIFMAIVVGLLDLLFGYGLTGLAAVRELIHGAGG